MADLNLGNLNPCAAKKISPFFIEILGQYRELIHSIHVTGTAITADYDEKASDVNTYMFELATSIANKLDDGKWATRLRNM